MRITFGVETHIILEDEEGWFVERENNIMIFIKIKQESKPRMERGAKKMIRSFFEWILPKANPDFENKIQLVIFWLIEFPGEDAMPVREIGLNDAGDVIVKMPDESNFGYWVDNNLTFRDFKKLFQIEYVTAEYFEKLWKSQ